MSIGRIATSMALSGTVIVESLERRRRPHANHADAPVAAARQP